MINEVKEIEGVSGIHVMAYRQEEYVAEIVHESGVLKGRKPWKREVSRAEAIAAAHAEGVNEGDIQNPAQMAEGRRNQQFMSEAGFATALLSDACPKDITI